MRFITSIVLPLASVFLVASAQASPDDSVSVSEDSSHSEVLDLRNFQLDYVIEEFAEIEKNLVIEAQYGQKITLQYSISNEEDEPFTVVGLGGSFRDPLTGEHAVNMTANSVEPVVIEPQSSTVIRQSVELDFPLADYILAPAVYVAFKDLLRVIQARGQFLVLKDAPVSFFEPQMLFLELLAIIFIGVASYYVVHSPSKKDARKKVVKQKSAITLSQVDLSWLPKNHQQIQTKKRSRKAY